MVKYSAPWILLSNMKISLYRVSRRWAGRPSEMSTRLNFESSFDALEDWLYSTTSTTIFNGGTTEPRFQEVCVSCSVWKVERLPESTNTGMVVD